MNTTYRVDTAATKSKNPHPRNGNHLFYSYSELYKLSYCLFVLVFDREIREKRDRM